MNYKITQITGNGNNQFRVVVQFAKLDQLRFANLCVFLAVKNNLNRKERKVVAKSRKGKLDQYRKIGI